MKLNKEQIIEVLKEHSTPYKVFGEPDEIIPTDEFGRIADKILTLMQPKISDDDIERMAAQAIPIYPSYPQLLDKLSWRHYINHLRIEWVKGYKVALKSNNL